MGLLRHKTKNNTLIGCAGGTLQIVIIGPDNNWRHDIKQECDYRLYAFNILRHLINS